MRFFVLCPFDDAGEVGQLFVDGAAGSVLAPVGLGESQGFASLDEIVSQLAEAVGTEVGEEMFAGDGKVCRVPGVTSRR